MSERQARHDDELDAETVAAWLREHPDFFERHEDVLIDMKIPHGGSAVSLIERQVNVLRDRNVELRHRLNQLLDVAAENDRLFEKTRRLLLKLMVADTVEAVYQSLHDSLKNDFGSQYIAMLLVHDDAHTSERFPFVRQYAAHDLNAHLLRLMNGNKAVCGVLRPDELAALFPGEEKKIGSAALVPLNWQGQWGLLAIGSDDPEHFKSSLGTLFISHIGEVVSRALAIHHGSEKRASA